MDIKPLWEFLGLLFYVVYAQITAVSYAVKMILLEEKGKRVWLFNYELD